MRTRLRSAVTSLAWLCCAAMTGCAGSPEEADLASKFADPPPSARPHTWWHWMNGMVTREGITADLESMARVGIGGAQIFNVDQGSPLGPAPFMSERWRELFRHAVSEAHRLGLSLCVHNCAGWSSSGGPWVKPEHAMLAVTISETPVPGGKSFDGKLPRPATRHGYYRDIAVLAIPTPGGAPQKDTLRIEGLPGKAAFVRADDQVPSLDTKAPADKVVAEDKILDLSGRMAPDGRLTWQAPPGHGTILRIGYTPTGAMNAPAPRAGVGLEVDKLSREAMDHFFAGMMNTVIDDNRPLLGAGLDNALIDSYEVGSQNWTPRFRAEFIRRRGYDPLPWLVILTGRVADNLARSERFLWDYRRTIAELFDENYFGYFAELCRRHGLLASVEPYGNGSFNDLTAGASFDIPMSEFWIGGGAMHTAKIASSIAHTNGRKIAGAESFTSVDRWLADPYSIKALGDRAFCLGVNRCIFHTWAMQPWLDKAPGMTMGPWGTHFGRTNTWWEQSTAWLKYVARCQYMLQQGRFVADLCYYVGEDSPVSLRVGNPPAPAGYDWDALSAEQLLNDLSVRDGRLALPGGMSYRVLVLPPSDAMTPRVARKIRQLVADGAVVVGPRPERSPSLTDYPACDRKVRQISDEVWGPCDAQKVTQHVYGKGKVIWGQMLEGVLAGLKTPPDFSSDRGVQYIHRRVGDTDVYFLANGRSVSLTAACTFRVSGKHAELWRPDSGSIRFVAHYTDERDGRMTIPIRFDPSGSVFVVFRPGLVPASQRVTGLTRDGRAIFSATSEREKVVIQKAAYGVLTDPQRTRDVRARVQEMVDRGQWRITVGDMAQGDDPAFGVVKTLAVEYTINGRPLKAAGRDPETIDLLDHASQEEGPEAVALCGADEGWLRLEVRRPGRYELRTADGRSRAFEVASLPPPAVIAGAWQVRFDPQLGGPGSVTFQSLDDWSRRPEEGIKYYSGTATYTRTIDVPASLLAPGKRVYLDLGKVKNIARVSVNGKDLGILWKPPFSVDVTSDLKAGENQLAIQITNLWPNRLIGDEQQPEDCSWQGDWLKAWPEWLIKGQPRPSSRRVTFTTRKQWNKGDALLESGLIGPVALCTAVIFDISPAGPLPPAAGGGPK